MTPNLRGEIRHRSNLCKKAHKQNTSEARQAYRKQRNKCTKLVRESQKAYFENVNNRNGKQFWKTIGPYMNDKGNHGNEDYILEEDGDLIKDPKNIGNIFCDYYTNIVESTTGSPPLKIPISNNGDIIDDIVDFYASHNSIKRIKDMNINKTFKIPLATENDIKEIIVKLDASKSNGIDNVSANLVKLAVDIISKPLCIILNRCIKQGKFPDLMKLPG